MPKILLYLLCSVCQRFLGCYFIFFPRHLNARKYPKILVEYWAKFEQIRADSLEEKWDPSFSSNNPYLVRAGGHRVRVKIGPITTLSCYEWPKGVSNISGNGVAHYSHSDEWCNAIILAKCFSKFRKTRDNKKYVHVFPLNVPGSMI